MAFSASETLITSGSVFGEQATNPETYHGKYVIVTGFTHFGHETTSIYLHREDYEQGLTRNGLWLQANDGVAPGSREAPVQNRYAMLVGRFNARSQGHLRLWSGSLEEITRMQPWPPAQALK